MPGIVRSLRRLSEMSSGELRHRLRESASRTIDRQTLRWSGARHRHLLRRLPLRGGSEPLRAYFMDCCAPRFFVPPGAAREELLALLAERFPLAAPRLAGEAEALCAHRVPLLGFGELALGHEIDWHRDPLSGQRWPLRFAGDYDLVNAAGAGDPKVVHELNRHLHLPRLAMAHAVTGRSRPASEAVGQLLGWVAQNPTGLGVNWHSSLEIALRVNSWLWTIFLLLPSRELDEQALRRIVPSLVEQLDWVARYPSVYSSPNTHLIAEAAALFLGGLVLSDCAGAQRWLATGGALLQRSVVEQVDGDGVHRELSAAYHRYAVELYLQVLALGRRNDHPLPPAIDERLPAMLEVLTQLARPDGTLPALGDDDGGSGFPVYGDGGRATAELAGCAALLFGRGDFKTLAGEFPESALWLLGARAWSDWQALRPAAPHGCGAALREAGYFVQRSSWDADAAHLVFDCGGLGWPTGGHGHADALSLVLFAQGRELLVDSGTFVYGGAPEWRDYFRSTRAHNTAVVDGRDQSLPGGTFAWRRKARVRVLETATFDEIEYAAGEHDGYDRPPGEVIHRRRLLRARGDYWLVIDDFRGRGNHEVEILYHFAPDADVAVTASTSGSVGVEARVGDAALTLDVCASAEIAVDVRRGELDPPQGWVARGYGDRRPAPVAVVRLRGELPLAAATLLVPRAAANGREWSLAPLAPPQPRGVLAFVAAGPAHEDVVLFSASGGTVDAGPWHGEGELFWAPLTQGRVRRLLAVRGRRFEAHGSTLLDQEPSAIHYSQPPLEWRRAASSVGEEDRHVRYCGHP